MKNFKIKMKNEKLQHLSQSDNQNIWTELSRFEKFSYDVPQKLSNIFSVPRVKKVWETLG